MAKALKSGFTLIEVLVVIGIILILIGLAVPALSMMSGSNSIAGAENNASAMLGRVRADAIATQKPTGVLFFIDPATQGVVMAEVQESGSTVGVQVTLDLVADRDFIALPKGVTLQTIDNAVLAGGSTGARQDDSYIGYNTAGTSGATTTQFGGVILFDAYGKLASRTYAFAARDATAAVTGIFNLLYHGKVVPDTGSTTPPATNFIPRNAVSAYGVVLMDRESFENNGNLAGGMKAVEDPQALQTTYGAEAGEETWIDENGTPLMVNRFNGTLLRAE